MVARKTWNDVISADYYSLQSNFSAHHFGELRETQREQREEKKEAVEEGEGAHLEQTIRSHVYRVV